MPTKIKWRNIDNLRLINLVRRVNAKITRVSKISEEMAVAQPERININEIREKLKSGTRAEYNIFINRYNRYMRKGAEEIYITQAGGISTNWAKKEIQYAIARQNRYMAKRRRFMIEKNIEPSAYRGSLGLANEFADRTNIFEYYSPTKLQRYINSVFKGEASFLSGKRSEQFRKNIYTALLENIGTLAENIINELEDFNDDNLLIAYMEEDILRFGYLYSDEEKETKYNEIIEYLNRLRKKYKIGHK